VGTKRTKKSLSKSLDYYEALICKVLANNTCQYPLCSRSMGLQWCHIVPRERKALRWARFNSMVLCKDHHYEYDHYMTAPMQAEFVDIIKPGAWVRLAVGIRSPFELTAEQMEQLLEDKKEEWKALKDATGQEEKKEPATQVQNGNRQGVLHGH
jgi:hypothetical protein